MRTTTRTIASAALGALFLLGACGAPAPEPAAEPAAATQYGAPVFTDVSAWATYGDSSLRWSTSEGRTCLESRSQTYGSNEATTRTCSGHFDTSTLPLVRSASPWAEVDDDSQVRWSEVNGARCLETRSQSYGSNEVTSFDCTPLAG